MQAAREDRSRKAVAGLAVVVAVAAAFGLGAVVGNRDDDAATKAADRDSARTVSGAALPPPSAVPARDPQQVPTDDPVKGTRSGSPLDDLPADVSVLTKFGQRPDWSPDAKHVVFLDGSPLGDVWTVEVDTGTTRELTQHGNLDERGASGSRDLESNGFSRAYYLSNGDLLLCGPTSGPKPNPDRPEAGRFTGVMSVLRAPFDDAPEPLGVPCWEGMATSGSSMQIAWNRSDIDYTDPNLANRVVNGITEIWIGEIRDVDGRATIVNARKALDRDSFGAFGVFEVQELRPPDDRELIFTAYAFQAGEVFGLDLDTGAVRNYSNSSAYEEVEGITPNGDAAYVERDLEYTGTDPGALDIWKLGLDDGDWERVTEFNRWAPFYASNPAVSPDGGRLAFQLSIDGETEGQGAGILLMRLRRG